MLLPAEAGEGAYDKRILEVSKLQHLNDFKSSLCLLYMDVGHLIEAQQFTPALLFSLFREADAIRVSPESYANDCAGKILATLFYEPSTRTRLSFESAMLRLGGKIIGTDNAREFSSAVKGESIEDTIRVIAHYANAIVLRHHEEGSALRASLVSTVPVINAGDGKGQHPTQALLDVYTMYRECGRLTNLKIAIVGDLIAGRTTHSLAYLLGKFENNELIFVSQPHLKMKSEILEYLQRHGVKYREESDIRDILSEIDVIYMTRIQKERLSYEEYIKARGMFVITPETLALLKPSTRILHPLPHVEEIMLPHEIEQNDSKVAYFRQTENGLFIRMALLRRLLTRTRV